MLIHNAVITGSLTLNGIDIGDITGSEASINALNAFSSSINTYTGSNDITNITQNNRLSALEITSGSLLTASSSFSTRVTNTETTASSLVNASSSFSTRVTNNETTGSNLVAASASFSTRTTNAESSITSLQAVTGSYATTSSNIFVGAQYISNITNAISFTSTGSLYTDGGMRISKDMYVSGTAYFNNVTVFGTQSISYISSSQLNIGDNLISVNTDTPLVRFGGLAVYDSGSTGLTGSLLWDSENNHWVYTNPSGSTYSGGMLISGPRAASLGTEQGTTACSLMVGQGGDHITSSAIFHYGNATCIPNTLAGGVGCFSGAVCSPAFVGGTVSGTTGTFSSNAASLTFGANDTVEKYMTIRFSNGDFFVGGTSVQNYIYGAGSRNLALWTNSTQRFVMDGNGVSCFACQVCVTGNADTAAGLVVNNPSGTSGICQHYINFTAGATTIGRIFRGNGVSGAVANGLNIDNFDGFQVRLNQLGGSGGTFNILGGNVGIGCSAPPAELTLADVNIDPTTNVYNAYFLTTTPQSPGRGATLGLGGETGGGPVAFALLQGAKENINFADTAGYLSLRTRPNGGGLCERMRISSVGNVGIGETGPAVRLHVAANNPTRGILANITNNAVSGHTGAQMQFTQNSVSDWVIGQPAGADAFAFWTGRYPSADGVERIRFTGTGIACFSCQICAFTFRSSPNTPAGALTVVSTAPSSQEFLTFYDNGQNGNCIVASMVDANGANAAGGLAFTVWRKSNAAGLRLISNNIIDNGAAGSEPVMNFSAYSYCDAAMNIKTPSVSANHSAYAFNYNDTELIKIRANGATCFSNMVCTPQLDVNGSARVVGLLTGNDRLYMNGNRPISDWLSDSLTIGYSSANSYGWVNSANNLVLGTNGTESMRFTSGGNLQLKNPYYLFLNSTSTTTLISGLPTATSLLISVTIQWSSNSAAQRTYLLHVGATTTAWGSPNSGITTLSSLDWSSGYVGAATFSVGGSGASRTLDISVSGANTYNVNVYALMVRFGY